LEPLVKLVAQVDGPAERTAVVASQGGRDRAFRTGNLSKRRIVFKDLVKAFFGLLCNCNRCLL
jgi:hypothetical protein